MPENGESDRDVSLPLSGRQRMSPPLRRNRFIVHSVTHHCPISDDTAEDGGQDQTGVLERDNDCFPQSLRRPLVGDGSHDRGVRQEYGHGRRRDGEARFPQDAIGGLVVFTALGLQVECDDCSLCHGVAPFVLAMHSAPPVT